MTYTPADLAPGTHVRLPQTKGKRHPRRGFGAEVYRWIGTAFLWLFGWKVTGDWPLYSKAVAIGAPHTTNWDGVLMIATMGHLRVRMNWMGKASLTTGPFGGFVRWLGCIPIDRSKANDMVSQMKEAFAEADQLFVGVPPEGTRTTGVSGTPWKSGFYHIAVAANVPIIICLLDWGTRHVRISGVYMPTGDIDADLKIIRSHYDGVLGKFTPRPR